MPAPKPPRRLVVYANPYFHLDHNGMPAGAGREVTKPHIRRWVGAKYDCRVNASHEVNGFVEVTSQDNWFNFHGEACSIENSREHRRMLNEGVWIAGDGWTAHQGSFPHKKLTFVPVDQALAAARQEAINAWKATYLGHETDALYQTRLMTHGEVPAFVAHEAENGSLAGAAAKPQASTTAPVKAPTAPTKGS